MGLIIYCIASSEMFDYLVASSIGLDSDVFICMATNNIKQYD